MISRNHFEALKINLTSLLVFYQIGIKQLQEVMELMEYSCLKE